MGLPSSILLSSPIFLFFGHGWFYLNAILGSSGLVYLLRDWNSWCILTQSQTKLDK
jgi:hypothetical protein